MRDQSIIPGPMRAAAVALLLTASAALAAGPGGLASCISQQAAPPGVGAYGPRDDYGSCLPSGVLPLGLGITAVVVAIQGRKRSEVSISSPGA